MTLEIRDNICQDNMPNAGSKQCRWLTGVILLLSSNFHTYGETKMSSTPSIELTAALEKNTYRVSEPVLIDVKVRNLSKQPWTLFDYGEPKLNAMFLFDVVVYSDKKKMLLYRPLLPPTVPFGRKAIVLASDQEWETLLDLRDWKPLKQYKMTGSDGVPIDASESIEWSPGDYTVQVFWSPLISANHVLDPESPHSQPLRLLLGQPHEVDFSLDLVQGLRDIDFHLITEAAWVNMKSPSPDAIARLDIPPDAPKAKVDEAISIIKAKGGYRIVETVVRRK